MGVVHYQGPLGVVKCWVYIFGPASNQPTSFLFHINLTINCWLRCSYSKIWPYKVKVKIMGDIKGQGCLVGQVSILDEYVAYL